MATRTGEDATGNGERNGNGHPSLEGLLDVIPSGPIPPDPGEFVATAALARLLETLSNRYDLVLIDAPPVLRVGDALTLASRVSALVIVNNLPRPNAISSRSSVESSTPARRARSALS